MPLTTTELRALLDGAGLHYFLDPAHDAVMLQMGGIFGTYQVLIALHVNGEFLQFRSLRYAMCPREHANNRLVLEVLAAINYRKRTIKFGWDPDDGEIVVYGDLWVKDGTITQQQFDQMAQMYFQGMDLAFGRIQWCLEKGEDPGEVEPGAPGPLGDKLRSALSGMFGGGDEPSGDEEIDKL